MILEDGKGGVVGEEVAMGPGQGPKKKFSTKRGLSFRQIWIQMLAPTFTSEGPYFTFWTLVAL